MKFKKGDNVIVFGSHSGRSKNTCTFNFCTVVSVGRYDLFCELDSSTTFKNLFRVSKKRCFKIPDVDIGYEMHKVVDPKIGDLVMSITDRHGKERKIITGLVEEIIYNPVKYESVTVKIRTGSGAEVVKQETIIILETS